MFGTMSSILYISLAWKNFLFINPCWGFLKLSHTFTQDLYHIKSLADAKAKKIFKKLTETINFNNDENVFLK